MGASGEHVSGAQLYKELRLTHPLSPSFQTTIAMGPSTQICPGCQQHFRPGGYANHLRFSRNPRCRAVRSSQLQTSSNALLTSCSDRPAHGPSPTPEPLSPDVEMVDIGDEPGPLTGSDSNPPPDRTTLTDQLDEWDQLEPAHEHDGLSHCLSPNAIVIDSDTDSDGSVDENFDRPLHRDNQTPPPTLVDDRDSGCATATQTTGTFVKLFSVLLTLTRNVR